MYTMIPDCLQNFMSLALGVTEIFCLQDFPMPKYLSLKTGRNFIKYLQKFTKI